MLSIECEILAHFDQFLAILLRVYALFGVLFTGLNNVAVYQNKQISGKGNQVKSFWGLRPSSIFRSNLFLLYKCQFFYICQISKK